MGKMKAKTIQMPLPAEAAGGKPVQIAERSPERAVEHIQESFSLLFSQSDSVKCIMATTNGVLNLQFIGNGCVANMQIYEVTSKDAIEEYTPHTPIRRTLNPRKGGTA
ncbi:hypothetical protein [Proteiniphilum sp.]|uniref:hypothetical protein n=1 Tax=Proteiniphilum sp. TaxID=1926877 RepID=UPI003319CDF6